jgi:hypothetical protein
VGLINDATGLLVDILEDANIVVTTDSRNARPGVTIIDPPTVTVINVNLYELQYPVTALLAPPGNSDAVSALLEIADDIILAVPQVAGGRPVAYAVGGQELPGYEITVQMTVTR